ncbi:hypothetical protein T484DRAFT_1987123 [Baffinella frigidus]|nr:hypothetical protein T484DRAFT_1987123 [Cryptophyta sp. CCMP2293]
MESGGDVRRYLTLHCVADAFHHGHHQASWHVGSAGLERRRHLRRAGLRPHLQRQRVAPVARLQRQHRRRPHPQLHRVPPDLMPRF